jgi:oligoendopeptidase F
MTATALPRWDVSAIFPALDSPGFAAAHEALVADLDRLTALYDRHDVRGGEARPPTDADISAFDAVLTATNDLLDEVRTLNAYLYTFVSTDARDDEAAARSGGVRPAGRHHQRRPPGRRREGQARLLGGGLGGGAR